MFGKSGGGKGGHHTHGITHPKDGHRSLPHLSKGGHKVGKGGLVETPVTKVAPMGKAHKG